MRHSSTGPGHTPQVDKLSRTTQGRHVSANGVGWALASALAFSLSSVVGKDLLGALGVASLLFWRFSVAATVLWVALLIWRRRQGPDPFAVPHRHLIGLGVLLGVVVLLGFEALERLDASVYIVLVYLYPAIVVASSAALGKHTPPSTWISLAVITVGVVLTVPEVFTGVGTISTTGVLLALGQAIAFAGYMMLSSRVVPAHLDGVVTAAWTNAGVVIFVTPFALIGGLTRPHGSHLLLEVGLFALIPTVAALVCFFRASRALPPAVVAMIMTLEVALAIAWSVIFLGEHLGLIELIGAAAVTVGVVIAQRTAAAAVEPLEVEPNLLGH